MTVDSYFQVLKIYFHALEIYFQALEIYFQALKIVLPNVFFSILRRFHCFFIRVGGIFWFLCVIAMK